MFAGVHTAIVTPFHNDSIDETALRRLIDRQFDNGIAGIVPVGTTGESATLDYAEHDRVIEISVHQAGGRGLVIAGTGSNSTREAIEMTRTAESAGAHASLQVAPYYNKPSQEGLFQHFKAIADNTSLPIMLYSIPGRCGIEIAVPTVARLAEACPNIICIKEAGGNADRVSLLREALPESFEILSGDDSLTLPFMSLGAIGVVSVAGNVIPGVMVKLVQAALEGNYAEALRLHDSHVALFKAFLTLDTNPVPVKTALALMGEIQREIRLPMVMMDKTREQQLHGILRDLGLVS